MTLLPIRLRRKGRTHAVNDTGELARQTLCNRSTDGGVIGTDVVDCKRCLRRLGTPT